MTTAHGVGQGYDGVAAVDGKHQVIVHAEAFGEPQEHALLLPMIEGVRENFAAIGEQDDIVRKAKLTADSGLHTEKNVEQLFTEGIDGDRGRSRVSKARSALCGSGEVQGATSPGAPRGAQRGRGCLSPE